MQIEISLTELKEYILVKISNNEYKFIRFIDGCYQFVSDRKKYKEIVKKLKKDN